MTLSPGIGFVWPPLIISSLLSLSSPNWLLIWTFLEINIFTFITTLLWFPTPLTTETTIKYLIVQATRSSAILLIATISALSHIWYTKIIITVSIIFKLGRAPFHLWFISVAKAINSVSFTFLITWQKILPLSLFYSYSSNSNNLTILILITINGLLGALGGISQTNIRPLLSYSSINHIGWIILTMKSSFITFIIYTLIYFLIIFIIIGSSSTPTPQNEWATPRLVSFNPYSHSSTINLLSLAGMPPLIGFIVKWIALINTSLYFITSILIIITMITLLYYIIITLVNAGHKLRLLINTNINYINITLTLHILTSIIIIII